MKRERARRVAGMLVGAVLVLVGAIASPAAAQVGLPPSYNAQAIQGPIPVLGAGFGDSATSAGDLNGDGEDDILTYQIAGSPGADGQVYVISGETGALIDTIVAPDQDTDAVGVGAAVPAPGDNDSNFAFPWISKLGNNRGNSPASYTDLASCPGASASPAPNPTQANPAPPKPLCPVTIGGPDGIPEILVGARGVDANGVVDSGRVYVFDGRTRVLLKRIDMPTAEAAAAVARGTAAARKGGVWFGRTALNPAGMPGCAGNSSVGACQSVPRAVEIGDMDGAGRPDLVIGASATTESAGPTGTAYPTSQCFTGGATGAFCGAAGRAYIYRGEDIVGSSPTQVLDGTGAGETVRELKNPDAQFNTGTEGAELFGNSLAAIGDVGRCTATNLAAGAPCPDAASTNVPDGRPDVIIAALRVDLPVNAPGGTSTDEGVSYLMDGATGTILRRYEHPDPQGGAVFGTQFQVPAPGDLGGSSLPDAYIPAAAQDTGPVVNQTTGVRQYPAGGQGFILNGDFKVQNLLLQTINDPTPHEAENFGYSSVGVGDLVGGAANPKNELLVASEGTFFTDRGPSDPAAPPTPNDLHFFNGATGRVLQTINDPGNQPGSQFGQAVTGLGDLNEDGFLDFAANAPLFNNPGGSGEGRMYIFRSQAPPGQPPPPPPVSGCVAGTSAGVSCVRNALGGLTITGTAGANRIVGSSGRDVIRCGDGDDVVLAGPGDDEIRCGAGNDTIEAGTGNDLADGESGNDRVNGGPGNDRLFGGTGNDSANGGSGNDVIAGGSGNDRLNGNEGQDRISGGAGRDRISGNEGNDSGNGGSGGDRLSGNSGRDSLVGGAGRDRLSGGSGNDRLNTRDRRRGDSANCGESRRDRDSATVDRGDRVRGCERVRRR